MLLLYTMQQFTECPSPLFSLSPTISVCISLCSEQTHKHSLSLSLSFYFSSSFITYSLTQHSRLFSLTPLLMSASFTLCHFLSLSVSPLQMYLFPLSFYFSPCLKLYRTELFLFCFSLSLSPSLSLSISFSLSLLCLCCWLCSSLKMSLKNVSVWCGVHHLASPM